MKKYRIKETVYKGGKKTYMPQVKIGIFGWKPIDNEGTATWFAISCITKQEANDCIKLHNNENSKVREEIIHDITKLDLF